MERGRIVTVSSDAGPPAGSDEWRNIPTVDLGDVAVLPGLVNAHTHLELSWMRGRVASSASMPAWAASLMALRRQHAAEPLPPIETAITEARAAGTALVGDVTNTLAPDPLLRASPLGGATFYELLGFSAPEPEQVVANARAALKSLPAAMEWSRTIVPHAPYSVSPTLFRAIGSA
ncbi:MAG: hypothetical protein ACJ731_15080, partial [Vicinamibacterales bacterium]